MERHDFDYVFMTVREPIARLKSEFHYRTRGAGRGSAFRQLRVPISFDAWVRWTLARYRKDPYVWDNHVRPQHEFLAFGAEVFRLEDGLDRVAEALQSVTGADGVQVSAARPPGYDSSGPSCQLTRRTLSDTVKHAANDFATFGYTLPKVL